MHSGCTIVGVGLLALITLVYLASVSETAYVFTPQPPEFSTMSDLIGKFWGPDEQCVSLIKTVCKSKNGNKVPATKSWKRGYLVRGHVKLPNGTAIATFDGPNNTYNRGKFRHAALYLSQNKTGILVIDQWKAKPEMASERLIYFEGHPGRNNGSEYYVVD